MSLYHLNLTLHILAAVVWLGGMLFFVVLAPVLRGIEPAALRRELFGAIGRRFRGVGWLCIGVLIATGFLNLYFAGILGGSWDAVWSTTYGRVLAIKLSLVGVMILVSALHDFVLGPGATRDEADAADPVDPADAPGGRTRYARQAAWIGRLNAVLGIIVVWLAVMLTRGV